jgi:hypothetical protein
VSRIPSLVRHGLTFENLAMRCFSNIAFRIIFGLSVYLRTNRGGTLKRNPTAFLFLAILPFRGDSQKLPI